MPKSKKKKKSFLERSSAKQYDHSHFGKKKKKTKMGRKLRPSNQTRYDVFYVFFFTNYLSLFEISLSLFEINKFEMIGLNGYVLKKFHEKSLLSLSLSLSLSSMEK